MAQRPARRLQQRGALAAAAAAAVLLVLHSGVAEGQMVSPLQGQGKPLLETQDVWFNAYLDRLIDVDDRNYRHKGIYMFYLTWNDSTAWNTVQRNTAAWLNGSRTCSLQCTDWGRDIACCDEIFIPSIAFRNAYAFPEDRPTLNKIYLTPPPSTTVMWISTVLGEFYQQMNLRNFPFDSFDLGIATEALDTAEASHPGLRWHLSSGGIQKYMYGAGDDVSDWRVTKVRLTAKLASNESFHFQLASPDGSHPTDPLPLSGPTASRTLTPLLPGGGTRPLGQPVSMLFIKVTVQRHWKYHLLNTILPVALLGWLSFVILVLDRRDLSTRLGVTVTLFLALAAVQFVVTADQPASSYILPTQQQVIATYCLLLCMAAEAILVHCIETYKERQKAAEQQRQARQRYLARLKAIKRLQKAEADAAACHAAGGLPSHQPPELAPAGAGACNGAAAAAAAAAAAGCQDSLETAPSLVSALQVAQEHKERGTEKTLTRSVTFTRRAALARLREAMEDDDLMCAWVAQRVDHACAAFLFIGYNLAVVLIYVLQSGYLDLLVWEGPPPPWGE